MMLGWQRLLATGVVAVIAASRATAAAAAAEPGVSRALAAERAARISDLHYQLVLKVKEHASAVDGSETVTFAARTAGDVPMDYRDGVVRSAALNGKPASTELVNGHLILPAAAGLNTLKVEFTSNAATAGKAITRYEDKDDGSEYFYTLFVPMDASMAFPCFDQPDLKGRFALAVEHPAGWTVIANTPPHATSPTRTDFAETEPISTYLFAFAAGPFTSITAQPGAVAELPEPTVYVRKSQAARGRQEAPQVQQMAARGVDYFAKFFARTFPFPKYDLVLIPGFPFGGMEHAGETFLNEDAVLFRSTPTKDDYFRRNTLVLHETCHQWFGDLVTMRWFDDLWLKEGFAQYMAYKALAELEPHGNAWKHFYEDIKPAAYGIDETQGTTPIFQSIANLKDAKSAYGAIVYQKAPAVLKQLEFRLGEDAFRNGLRTYLKTHAYGNAEWSDLIGAFKSAQSSNAGNGGATTSDVNAWADAWIRHRGMPEVHAVWRCEDGKLAALTLSQHDVLPDGLLWPVSNEVALGYEGGRTESLRVDWAAASVEVKEAAGKPCPQFVFANGGDEAYGRFLLDAASEAAVARNIADPPASDADPLLRTMLWGALWDNVRVARSAPHAYIDLALRDLPYETDESLARIQGGRIAAAMHSYLSDLAREALAPHVESVVEDRMLHAPTLGLRIVNFRTFTGVAETDAGLQKVKDLLSGKLVVEGLTLKPLDRWNLIGHLIAMGDQDAQHIFADEKKHDTSGEGQRYAYASEAGTANAEMKSRYFDEYLHNTTIQEDWITQSLRPFNAWNQAALTQNYLLRALKELPEIKQHRKIFFLGAWLGAFVDGQNTLAASPKAQAAVREFLATEKIDPDLRLKVLEAADALDKTVAIGKAFSQ